MEKMMNMYGWRFGSSAQSHLPNKASLRTTKNNIKSTPTNSTDASTANPTHSNLNKQNINSPGRPSMREDVKGQWNG